MDTIQVQNERRRYYRLEPSSEAKPRVVLEINGKEYEVEVINISPGGLLGYVTDPFAPLGVDQMVSKIVIRRPERTPLLYSGRVLRLQHEPEKNRRFCAIEFLQFEEKVLHKGARPIRPFTPGDGDREFLHRLKTFPQLQPGLALEKEFEIRESLFRAFEKEAVALPLEERWYFYEVLEEMKHREPDWPEGLKREFLRLCRGEIRSEFVSREAEVRKRKSLLRRFWPF